MSPIRMDRLESAIRIVIKYNEAFNRHDVEGMLQLLSNGCIFESSDPGPDGTVYSGKGKIALALQGLFRESSDATRKVEDIFGFGNRCILLWRYEWEKSTGKTDHLRGVDIFQVINGAISEILSYSKG